MAHFYGQDALPVTQQCEVKVLKDTQSTDPIQWLGIILSSSTTSLLKKGTLLPLCRLSSASLPIPLHSHCCCLSLATCRLLAFVEMWLFCLRYIAQNKNHFSSEACCCNAVSLYIKMKRWATATCTCGCGEMIIAMTHALSHYLRLSCCTDFQHDILSCVER